MKTELEKARQTRRGTSTSSRFRAAEHSVMRLQSTLGNGAVLRLMRSAALREGIAGSGDRDRIENRAAIAESGPDHEERQVSPASGITPFQKAPRATVQRVSNPITEKDLPSPKARKISKTEAEYRNFTRLVFQKQVGLWTAAGGTYVHELPKDKLESLPSAYTIGRAVSVLKGIKDPLISMLSAAAADLSAQKAGKSPGPAASVAAVGVRSGYRPAADQFEIWKTNFPKYYKGTKAERQDASKFPGGEHSDEAALFLANYVNQRVYSPGYSPHQHGYAVDLSYKEGSTWAEADTSAPAIAVWKASWFFNWLLSNAPGRGFHQNPKLNEPWHWEYDPPTAWEQIIMQLLKWLEEIIDMIVSGIKSILGQEKQEDEPKKEDAGKNAGENNR